MDLLNKIDMFVGYDAKSVKEETEYQKFFKGKLKEAGVKSPSELEGDKKTEFFNMIKKEWKGSTNESWYVTEETEYQKFFAKKLKATGKGIADMDDGEKKEFFDMIKKEWKGSTNEGDLPPALKKAIEAKKKKDGDKEEDDDESKEHEDSESDEEEKKEQEKGDDDDDDEDEDKKK